MRALLLCVLLAVTALTAGNIRSLPLKHSPTPVTPPDLRDLIVSANRLFLSRDFPQAIALYQKGVQLSSARNEIRSKGRFLHGLGNCYLLTADYQTAVAQYLKSREVSQSVADWITVALVSTSLYTAYSRMGDLASASQSMQEALASMPWDQVKGNLPHVLINLANAKSKQGDFDAAERYFGTAITAADDLGDNIAAVEAWSGLGHHYLLCKELSQADHAYTRAFYLRKMAKVGSPAESDLEFGMLRLAQGDSPSAIRFLEEGLAIARRQSIGFPVMVFYRYLGRARAAAGDLRGAFEDLETALTLAKDWRLDVVPTDVSRTGAEVTLQDLYSDYIETGMKLYALHPSPDMSYRMFLAAEGNRAVSFRERLQTRKELPSAYWKTLDELQRAEIVRFRNNTDEQKDTVDRLRLRLAQIEFQAKVLTLGHSTNSRRKNENSGSVKSLKPIQGLITQDEALISFHLGETQSYVWAFTKEGFHVCSLPRRAWISDSVRAFQEAVRTGAADAVILGRTLYHTLFGALPPGVVNKKQWLLILDDTLFAMPAPALVVSNASAPTRYLIERNSLRVLPTAEMLRLSPQESPSGPFLGVGDPIYNTADSRWHPVQVKHFSWSTLFHFARTNPIASNPELTRLVGSGREVQVSAAAWQSNFPAAARNTPVLLQGKLCQRTQIEDHLKAGPIVVHFAAHVVQPPKRPEEALIAIGLDSAGEPDFLTISEISNWRYALDLVVLSGCSSGTGKALPGAGLFGLSRAWLIAGARTAIASQWATPDDSGTLFRTFYQSLAPPGHGLSSAADADALQKAQVEMLRSQTWRSEPKFWAAFFVVGKD
ncbi:MAG: CHAT domain-containing protein [Bryobacteraceae bacterium]